jgi:hypothetical protein
MRDDRTSVRGGGALAALLPAKQASLRCPRALGSAGGEVEQSEGEGQH